MDDHNRKVVLTSTIKVAVAGRDKHFVGGMYGFRQPMFHKTALRSDTCHVDGDQQPKQSRWVKHCKCKKAFTYADCLPGIPTPANYRNSLPILCWQMEAKGSEVRGWHPKRGALPKKGDSRRCSYARGRVIGLETVIETVLIDEITKSLTIHGQSQIKDEIFIR